MEENKSLAAQYGEAAEIIKTAILQSQYEAAKGVNRVQLALYFGIGKFLSAKTRRGVWGTGAIQDISDRLHKQLPGLRGFSTNSLKNMRKFYESWNLLDSAADVNIKPTIGSVNSIGDNSTIAIVELQDIDDQVKKAHENPSIGIILCKEADREYVEYVIQDYARPMGVATYTVSKDMPEKLRSALPDIEDLKKLL